MKPEINTDIQTAVLRHRNDEKHAKESKPKIVTICGSSRFVDIMAVCAWIIERDENAIVLSLHLLPAWHSKDLIADHLAEHEGVAGQKDELHLRKIDLATEEIFVVNYGDYIGDSTTKEIGYAKETGKRVRWFTHDPVGEKVIEIAVAFNEINRLTRDMTKEKIKEWRQE